MRYFFFILLSFVASKLRSQTILTDRPGQTETPFIPTAGGLQVETGISVEFSGEGLEKQREIQAPYTLLRYAILRNFELRVVNQLQTLKLESEGSLYEGIGDLELGAKWQFLNTANARTQVALLSHLVLPTGTTDISGELWGANNMVTANHQITPNFAINYNVGCNFLEKNPADFIYAVSFEIGLTDKVGVYVEHYGNAPELNNFTSNFSTGFTYLFSDDAQFDFSFGSGINQKMNFVSVGYSWRMKNAE